MSSSQSGPSTCASTEECSCSTVQFDEIKYTWKIYNFSSVDEAGESVLSPTFSSPTNDKFQWYLSFDPRGEDGEKDYFGLFLHLNQTSKCKRALAKFSFSLLSNTQKESYVSGLSCYLFNIVAGSCTDAGEWGCSNFLKKDETFKSTFLPKDTDALTISLKITFLELNDVTIDRIFHRCNILHLQQLSENLASALGNHEFADFTLSLPGKDYPVHKVILAARSNYFANMFKSSMMENERNRVEITDVKEDVMGEIMKFFYTGKCENVDKLADGLLAAADKYGLVQLKKMCVESISKSLSVENAPNMLILADLYRVDDLKSQVIEFIVARSSEIMNSTTWDQIMPMYPQVLNDVCKALSRSRFENTSM
ncbi:speckle-type POZ protein-like [Planococcus citri]|uniref:speckle-type POZ protein-like n=1 Tax=Planococcus citri TaxID=170843 RepID=UPI0031F7ECCF